MAMCGTYIRSVQVSNIDCLISKQHKHANTIVKRIFESV